MKLGHSKIIAAVEIGTDKVVVLVGELCGDRQLNIIGRGETSSIGLRKGEIVDFRSASEATHAAFAAAEKSAGADIESVYLAQSGAHLRGFRRDGSVSVRSAQNEVGEEDIDQAIREAKSKVLPDGRVYIHHIRQGFRLDGEWVDDPLGMRGEQLEACYWHVHGEERHLGDQIRIANHYGVKVEDVILSSLASASMVATSSERRNGVLVVDVGRGTTDFILYRGGAVAATGVIPVGGDHFTNDLAMGLRTDLKHAETLKVQYAKTMIEKADKTETIWLYGDLEKGNTAIGNRRIPRSALAQILQPRVRELFQIIRRRLGEAYRVSAVPGGLILTGGSSHLPGLAETGSDVMALPVRAGTNPDWVQEDLRKAEYSTVLGLLYFGLSDQGDEHASKERGLMRKIARILTLS